MNDTSSTELTVLVVDDAVVDRCVTGAIIENNLGWRVTYAEDGVSALAATEREPPHVLLTDMRMPGMDGLELVSNMRNNHPSVPVVLMTAFGNENIALEALREGAASYVSKKSLEEDLVPTLEQVAALGRTERRNQRLLGSLSHTESCFVLDNDPEIVPAVVAHVQGQLAQVGFCDRTEGIRLGVAVEEALLNALYHGNLEIGSELRQQDDEPYRRLGQERRCRPPYCDRRVHFTYRLSSSEASFVVRDEGPGFDPSKLPDPADPANLEKASGRGLLLIRTFADEVFFGEKGNQITFVKRAKGVQPSATKRHSS